MKKFIFLALFVMIAAATAMAQPRAIGGRFGYGGGFSYEHGIGKNMVSLDAGVFGFYGVEAVATFDWINPFNAKIPWAHKGEWNWYMGVGAGAGFSWWNFATVGVAGRFGVEYNFWFPLQLSVDWRPLIGPAFYWGSWAVYDDIYVGKRSTWVGFNFDGLYAGALSVGVRYKF